MLTFNGKENGAAFSCLFNQGEHTSESYLAYTHVCQNPVCQCNVVDIKFVPTNDIELDNKQAISFEVSLDVVSKSITPETKGEINENFANSLVKDFSEEDWGSLYKHYISRKIIASEATDLTTVDAVFPVEDIEYESLLIFYSDIIPYSRPVILTVEKKNFYVDDMYCVKPDCHCNEAHLLFIPYDNSGQLETSREEETYIILNLKTHFWGLKERGKCTISGKALMDTFFEKEGIVDLYKTRYKTMRELYKKYRSTSYQNNTVRTLDKVGRNDPCPCGSGKKYKKCCL